MGAILLPEPMIQFLEVHAQQQGFANASMYLQSIIQELQCRHPANVDDALRQAMHESGFLMTPGHWRQFRETIFEKNPELKVECD